MQQFRVRREAVVNKIETPSGTGFYALPDNTVLITNAADSVFIDDAARDRARVARTIAVERTQLASIDAAERNSIRREYMQKSTRTRIQSADLTELDAGNDDARVLLMRVHALLLRNYTEHQLAIDHNAYKLALLSGKIERENLAVLRDTLGRGTINLLATLNLLTEHSLNKQHWSAVHRYDLYSLYIFYGTPSAIIPQKTLLSLVAHRSVGVLAVLGVFNRVNKTNAAAIAKLEQLDTDAIEALLKTGAFYAMPGGRMSENNWQRLCDAMLAGRTDYLRV